MDTKNRKSQRGRQKRQKNGISLETRMGITRGHGGSYITEISIGLGSNGAYHTTVIYLNVCVVALPG